NPGHIAIDQANLALVRWQLHPTDHRYAWGPFPVRASDGTIAFPKSALGGWCWKDEYLTASKIWHNVSCTDAWLYHTDCDCQPFKDIPHYYRERCRIGSDGAGIVFKLGPNAVYGKLAQSKGFNPPFQCWIWAGNITSGCRAQLLSAFLTKGLDPWDILMFATDGIFSRVPLTLPEPKDTGTINTGKPLGSWEHKEFRSGVFCVRPGIYFPMNPTESQLKEVRARGLGKKVLYEQWPRIIEQYEKTGTTEALTID